MGDYRLKDASFTRTSSAYDDNGNFYNSGVPRIVPGQGLLIEEGTTNLLTNIQYLTTSGVLSYQSATLTANLDGSMFPNTKMLQVDTSATTGSGFGHASVTATTGQSYTFSVYLKGSGQVQLFISERDSSDNWLAETRSATITLSNSWVRYTVSGTNSSGAKIRVGVLTAVGQAVTFYATAPQLEQKPYATTFVDGTRAGETVTIPQNVVNPQEFTIFVKAGQITKNVFTTSIPLISNWNSFVSENQKGFLLRFFSNSYGWKPRFTVCDGANYVSCDSTIAVNPNLFSVAGVYKAGSIFKVYTDGVLGASQSSVPMTCVLDNTIYLGYTGVNAGYLTGKLYQILIYNRALSDTEIADLAAGKLLIDSSTTYYLDFSHATKLNNKAELSTNSIQTVGSIDSPAHIGLKDITTGRGVGLFYKDNTMPNLGLSTAIDDALNIYCTDGTTKSLVATLPYNSNVLDFKTTPTVNGTLLVKENDALSGGLSGKYFMANGYQTQNTGASYSGYWAHLATVTISAQYHFFTGAFSFVYGYNTSSPSNAGIVTLRVKQQAALGSPPIINLLTQLAVQAGGVITHQDFAAVLTQNTTSATEVKLYVRIPYAYEIVYFHPLISRPSSSTTVTWHDNAVLVSALPGGTVTYGVPVVSRNAHVRHTWIPANNTSWASWFLGHTATTETDILALSLRKDAPYVYVKIQGVRSSGSASGQLGLYYGGTLIGTVWDPGTAGSAKTYRIGFTTIDFSTTSYFYLKGMVDNATYRIGARIEDMFYSTFGTETYDYSYTI